MLTSDHLPAPFRVNGRGYLLDGEPFTLLSGALHYFRVHPRQWEHRLAMLRGMGLNTVETYVPWNFHEPRPGEYRRVAWLGEFLDAAAAADLKAIVRPGPYICAEWDNGGLPVWLTQRAGRRIRSSDPGYLSCVDRWFDELVPVIAKQQITRGGNVLMVQVENEYGSYGTDQAYLRHLAEGLRAREIDVPLFTSDGPEDHMLTGGTVPGVPSTANFGSRVRESFDVHARHRPDDPLVCMEYWNGWFDSWGKQHHTRDPADAADVLAGILEQGAGVNIYMACGGTNFATWSGANLSGPLQDAPPLVPITTSYDYDAPVDEHGAPTRKYWRFREILSRYNTAPEPPGAPPLLEPAEVALTESASLRDVLPDLTAEAPMPLTFDELGLNHGVVAYRAEIPGPRQAYPLSVAGLRDRAHVYVNGGYSGTIEHDEPEGSIDVAGPATVELLVESLGRVNYGPCLGEPKGILGGVRHERQYLHGWVMRALPLGEEQPDVAFSAGTGVTGPAFYRGTFTIGQPADAFIDLPGWKHGQVWVNGFGLGRYWDREPRRGLYLPSPVLHGGVNEIVVLELDRAGPPLARLRPSPA